MVNNIKIGKKIIVLAVIVFVILPVFVHAVSWLPLVPCGVGNDNPDTPQDERKPCNQCDLLRLLKNIIDFVLIGLMPPAAAILFVWGGFLILMGGANPGWITQGKSIFWNTAIGVAIISSSWLITNTIIRSIAADNVAPEWWKFECRVTVPAEQPPAPEPELGPEQPPVPEPEPGQPPVPVPPGPQPEPPAPQPPVSTNLNITTVSLSDARQDFNYSQTIQATGGKTPYNWSISGSSQLPSGLMINGSTGEIFGKPTVSGNFSFTVGIQDSSSPIKQTTKQLSIKVASPAASVVISNVASSNITANSATITWITDKPSSSQVAYGTTTAYGSNTSLNNTQVTSHSISITGLSPGTIYNYQAISSITGFTARSSNNTFKTTGQPPAPQPPPPPIGGNCSGVQCSDSNLNVCGQNTGASCSESVVNKWDTQIKAAVANNQVGSGINSVALIKAIISQESGGRTNIDASDGKSYGILQLRPDTANDFKSGCTSANITSAWLKDSNNVQASVCIAINYLRSLVSSCGTSVRNLAAGYNGGGAGKGACALSQSCASCSVCGSEQTRRWECLWDGPDGEHKVCNVDREGNFNHTRKYVPKVNYCYNKFGGSSGTPGGGTGNLTLASIDPATFTAGKEKSFNQQTGVVEYTYLDVPFEIKGSGLTGATLTSNNTGVDGKPGIEFKNLQITDTSIKGVMIMHSTAKDGTTTVTVRNGDKTVTKDITVKITGTQYLKRKFADNPKVSFRGNWSGLMPDPFVENIESGIRNGLRATSSNNYKQLDIASIMYEEDYFHKNFGSCGGLKADEIAGCASPLNNIIHIKIQSKYPEDVAKTILHELAHKLHFFNLGDYKGIPNAPKTPSNFQNEWNFFNIVTPANSSNCPFLPLKDIFTWNDGTYSFHCVFAEPYGVYLLPGDKVFFEDPTTMTANYYFKVDSFGSGEAKNNSKYIGKINVLKKYGFLP